MRKLCINNGITLIHICSISCFLQMYATVGIEALIENQTHEHWLAVDHQIIKPGREYIPKMNFGQANFSNINHS